MKLFLKNLLFTILIPGTVSVYLPLLIVLGKPMHPSLGAQVSGVFLLALGSAIYLWTVWDFAIQGRGTPLPLDAPKKLVVRGLYHYVRNPMYLGVLLVIVGWAVLFTNVWLLLYTIGVGVLVHLFVVFYEEPRLMQLFGIEYADYLHRVSRWLPRVRGRE